MGPLRIVRVRASKLLEASADVSVEGFKGASMEAGRHNPDREDHLAEGGAAAEQLEGDLRVRNLAEGGEDAERFVDPVAGVLFTELRRAHRSPKQLEVTIPNDFEVRRESGNIDN